jgi:serine/threonine protein kinase
VSPHRHKIIHRDIKPANIFVHNQTLKVGDFGLSQQLFEKKQEFYDHRTIGTFLTSAPQLIFKEPYTNKCDIYSLGLTLYWMLFQKFPFDHISGLDREALMKESLSLEHDTPLRCSPEVAHLLKQMLAFKEDDRIDWPELFAHPLFQRIRAAEVEATRVRETIGRNLQGQNLSIMLENTIPDQFYRYIGEENDFEMTGLVERGSEKGATLCFKKVVMEGVNFSFKIYFLKMVLKEVYETGHEEKIKNKVEFLIVKDLLRLGIYKYPSPHPATSTTSTAPSSTNSTASTPSASSTAPCSKKSAARSTSSPTSNASVWTPRPTPVRTRNPSCRWRSGRASSATARSTT